MELTAASLPARGAWVEIRSGDLVWQDPEPPLPARGAWVEIRGAAPPPGRNQSLPARGAWVEIVTFLISL